MSCVWFHFSDSIRIDFIIKNLAQNHKTGKILKPSNRPISIIHHGLQKTSNISFSIYKRFNFLIILIFLFLLFKAFLSPYCFEIFATFRARITQLKKFLAPHFPQFCFWLANGAAICNELQNLSSFQGCYELKARNIFFG